jgi:hypothetical protein
VIAGNCGYIKEFGVDAPYIFYWFGEELLQNNYIW